MKQTITAVGAVFLSLLAAPAWSQDAGFYVGGSIGQSRAQDSCDDVTAFSCDDKDTAWKLLAGYQFNRHFAAEFGYTELGEFTIGGALSGVNVTGTIEAAAFELVGVGSLPLMERFSAYGKLGAYYAETEATVTGTLGTFSISQTDKETNTGVTFGLGLRYDFTRNLGIRGEWQRYLEVGGGDIGEDDIDVFSVGLIWRF
jgi:OOP family OmpA-OmpF porin